MTARTGHRRGAADDGQLLREIIALFAPQRRYVVCIALLLCLTSLTVALVPLCVAWGLNLLVSRDAANAPLLAVLGLSGVALVTWFSEFAYKSLSARAVARVTLELRQTLFSSTLRQGLDFFDANSSGELVSRVASDTQELASVLKLLLELLGHLLTLAIIAGILGALAPGLALVVYAALPVLAGVALLYRRAAREISRRVRKSSAAVHQAVQESVNGLGVAKAFRHERALFDDFCDVNARAYQLGLSQSRLYSSMYPVLNTVSGLFISVTLVLGARALVAGTLTVGGWYIFAQFMAMLVYPLLSLTSFWSQFQRGLAAAERALKLNRLPVVIEQRGRRRLGDAHDGLSFWGLSMRYPDGTLALRDVSFEVAPGQTAALVGRSGAGKSSLVRALLRFHDFQAGSVAVGGCDVRYVDLLSLRRHVGVIPQFPFIFTGTVADNIRAGQPGVSDDAIARAAAFAGDWLCDLPAGLDTHVGRRGALLSQGQKQLIALARICLLNPKILVLDEATSNLDPFSERRIRASLDRLMQGRTTLIVSHRLENVARADMIVVLEGGCVVEAGRPDVLHQQRGAYSRLLNARRGD